MATLVRCVCGKRYRIPENTSKKFIHCKDCGEELPLPDAPVDEEWDESIESDSNDDSSDASQKSTRRGKRKKKRHGSAGSSSMITSDLLVRGAGLSVFLATLIYAIYGFVFFDRPVNMPIAIKAVGVCWPMVIFGFIGLYIGCIGEEPNKVRCRQNRILGLTKCGIGVVMIAGGAALSLVFAMAQMGLVFIGLIGGGVLFIVFGFLGALTGRDFKHAGWQGDE